VYDRQHESAILSEVGLTVCQDPSGGVVVTNTVESVTRDELRERRARLLRRAGMSWSELRRRARAYTITDDQRSIHDTIRGIDWMLKGKA
jgi:hypothetical protein